MTVLVLGASSQIGVFLLPRLLDAGYPVVAVSRKAPQGGRVVNSRLTWVRDQADACSKLHRVKALVTCGPLSLLLHWLPELPALERCVGFSSSSVHTKNLPAIDELRETESKVQAALAQRQIPLCLLRPTLVYGCGQDRNVSLLEAIGRRTGLIPVSTAAQGLRQPVHADDLALAAVSALKAEKAPVLEGEICGGSTLSYRQMAEAITAAGTGRMRVLSLPPSLYRFVIRLLRRSSRWKNLEPGMVTRQAQDLVFDDRLVRTILGVNPRRFNPVQEDFIIPARARQLQLPRRSDGGT